MLDLQAIAVLAFATYRIAQLVTTDTLTEPFRNRLWAWAWIMDADQGSPRPRAAWRTWVDNMLTCAQCIGVWTAGGLYALWDHWHAARWVITIAAVAGLASLCAWAATRLSEPVEHG